MTDKQIIIDGVDVSGCEFFDSGNCVECDMRAHFYGDIPCDDECNRNCYYKQLKAKEQECEELKKLLKVRIEDLCDSCGASSMMPMPCKVYEKTLTEIKEIAEHCIIKDICTFCDYSDRCYIEDEEIPTYDVCKLILQKISEVEDG